jgi:hypothetical protein
MLESTPAPAQGYVTVGVGIVCLCQSATIIHLIGLSGRRVPSGRACALLSEAGPPITPKTRHRMRQDYPLNLSISLSGGEETNQDAPSNGE